MVNLSGYEPSFLEALEPALENLAKKGIKLAANAGTVATKDLFDIVVDMAREKGLDLCVAWVEGDVVLEQVQTALKEGTNDFVNFITGQKLKDWPFKPLFARMWKFPNQIIFRTGAPLALTPGFS